MSRTCKWIRCALGQDVGSIAIDYLMPDSWPGGAFGGSHSPDIMASGVWELIIALDYPGEWLGIACQHGYADVADWLFKGRHVALEPTGEFDDAWVEYIAYTINRNFRHYMKAACDAGHYDVVRVMAKWLGEGCPCGLPLIAHRAGMVHPEPDGLLHAEPTRGPWPAAKYASCAMRMVGREGRRPSPIKQPATRRARRRQ